MGHTRRLRTGSAAGSLGVFGAGLIAWLLLLPLTASADELQEIRGVTLVPTSWADGDSFRVRFPDRSEHTLRLYGADCIELNVRDDADARRLLAQRRWFGIAGHGGTASASIELAKSWAGKARDEVRALLAKPFTVRTAFADGGGDPRFRRIYAFVTTASGEDLATLLVSGGLARAFGVFRSGPDGAERDDYRESLHDAELTAVALRRGIWAHTDWNRLALERRAERRDEAETSLAKGREALTRTLDVNRAAREELMRIPGVGEVTAKAIIAGRPYRRVDDLLRVRGIGRKTLERIRPWVTVTP